MTPKKWANLLEFSAHYDYDTPPTPGAPAPLHITLPDGRILQAQDPDVSAVLSTVLGRPVVLDRVQGDRHNQVEIDPTTVFGDVPVEQVKPGFTAATMTEAFTLQHRRI